MSFKSIKCSFSLYVFDFAKLIDSKNQLSRCMYIETNIYNTCGVVLSTYRNNIYSMRFYSVWLGYKKKTNTEILTSRLY